MNYHWWSCAKETSTFSFLSWVCGKVCIRLYVCECARTCTHTRLVAQLCLTLCGPSGTAACQASLSMEFSFKNIGAGCHFLLQGIFLSQGSNPYLLHWQADSLTTEQPGQPFRLYNNPPEYQVWIFGSRQGLSRTLFLKGEEFWQMWWRKNILDSLGGPYMWWHASLEGGGRGRLDHRREDSVTGEAGAGRTWPLSQGPGRLLALQEARQILLYNLWKDLALPTPGLGVMPLVLDFQPQTVRIYISGVLSPWACGHLLEQPQETNTVLLEKETAGRTNFWPPV